jgi:sarcosine oxidase gamma subunit
MADAPARQSPLLPHRFAAGAPGPRLSVRARGPLEIAQVAAYGAPADAAVRLSQHLGLAVATTPNRAMVTGDVTVLWHGPARWLAVRAKPAEPPLIDELAAAFAETAAVVDLGHARAALRFDGEAARDLLAKRAPARRDAGNHRRLCTSQLCADLRRLAGARGARHRRRICRSSDMSLPRREPGIGDLLCPAPPCKTMDGAHGA